MIVRNGNLILRPRSLTSFYFYGKIFIIRPTSYILSNFFISPLSRTCVILDTVYRHLYLTNVNHCGLMFPTPFLTLLSTESNILSHRLSYSSDCDLYVYPQNRLSLQCCRNTRSFTVGSLLQSFRDLNTMVLGSPLDPTSLGVLWGCFSPQHFRLLDWILWTLIKLSPGSTSPQPRGCTLYVDKDFLILCLPIVWGRYRKFS